MYNEARNQYYTACLPHLTDIASLMYQLSSLLWYGALQLLTFSAKKKKKSQQSLSEVWIFVHHFYIQRFVSGDVQPNQASL